MDRKQCNRCKVNLPLGQFNAKRSGDLYKVCTVCNEKQAKTRERNKKRYHCVHNRSKYCCKECHGGSICEHGRNRTYCRECKGGSICEHNKSRSRCRECYGGAVCEHDRVRTSCRECRGGSMCACNKEKTKCIKCGGGSICEHNKRRSQCVSCSPEKACQNCLSIYVPKQYRFYPHCFRCYCSLNPDTDIPRQYKLKERHLKNTLRSLYPTLEMVFDKAIEGGHSNKRPDVRIDCLSHTIIIECDENQHCNYFCEDERIMELFQDLGGRPMVVIRFNPDAYREDGTKIQGCFSTNKSGVVSLVEEEWSWRIKELRRTIGLYLDSLLEQEIVVRHLFYDCKKSYI